MVLPPLPALKIHCSQACRDLLGELGGFELEERGVVTLKVRHAVQDGRKMDRIWPYYRSQHISIGKVSTCYILPRSQHVYIAKALSCLSRRSQHGSTIKIAIWQLSVFQYFYYQDSNMPILHVSMYLCCKVSTCPNC